MWVDFFLRHRLNDTTCKSRSVEAYDTFTQLGVDEKSYNTGHKYLTICSDMESRRVILDYKPRRLHSSLTN